MKRHAAILLFVGILCLGLDFTTAPAAPWAGVDETVIEKFAGEAGRPAREPLINTDQGDLLLALFLLAGAAGGFAAGYWFRVLFPGRRQEADGAGRAPGEQGRQP